MMKNLLTTLFFCFGLNLLIAQSQSRSVPIDLDEGTNARAQVFVTDLIVQGSECVGFDCATSESFGFDTERLKENNLRIHFDDTSNSASFPKRDWRIVINDTRNGGAEYFGIEDATAGRQVFRIEGNAPLNALYVSDAGDVGIGTDVPVVEVHAVDGNTPALRLEQNGSNGFTPQTWDVAGNETNFFVRDVTNGSKLPFRIEPNTPQNALYLDASGKVGLGKQNPTEKLEVVGGNVQIDNNTYVKSLRSDGTTGHQLLGMDNNNDIIFNRNAIVGGSLTSGLVFAATNDRNIDFRNGDNTIQMRLSPSTGDLTLFNGDGFKPGGGDWMTTSDKRAKQSVRPFEDGLEKVLEINPVFYQYNGKYGTPNNGTEYIGVLAQDLQEVAPYMVSTRTFKDERRNTIESFLSVDATAIRYMLVNSIKEQQQLINEQKLEIQKLSEEVEDLKAMRVEFELIKEKILELESGNSSSVLLKGSVEAYLGQNYPNPYINETVIEYSLPSSISKAELRFSDLSGKLIKSISLTGEGNGKIDVKAQELPHGSYHYSLVIDGNIIDTKKMILSR